MMADCRTCRTRITTLRGTWVHLALELGPAHDPEPPPTHSWHKKQADLETYR